MNLAPQTILSQRRILCLNDKYSDDKNKKKDNWGGGAKGAITFGNNGRFTQIIVGHIEASLKGADPRRPAAPVVAYYGSYTVDEAGKKVSVKIEAASYSPRAGTESAWTVSGSGDTLTLTGTPRKDEYGTFSPVIEVKRVK